MEMSTLLTSALCAVLMPVLLLCIALKLWDLYFLTHRDRSCKYPLPPGTMGVPFFGETLNMVLQRKKFLTLKRKQYGRIYKTHLFGTPTVRIMGAENVRQILLGEHKLVSVHWPTSVRTILGAGCLSNLHDSEHKDMKKVIMQAFSREALENYVPIIQEEMRRTIHLWLNSGPSILVYPAVKRLMFRIAMRILLGFEPHQMGSEQEQQLVEAFEEMIKNLFSLPIDVPFSGLYRGMKARNIIHSKIEENIKEKLLKEPEAFPKDALQLLIDYKKKYGEPVDLKALKESATELLFGGHGTTASAGTSLITFLGLNKEVVQKVRNELETMGLLTNKDGESDLSFDKLQKLKYTSCVLNETLRLCSPVPGGFRVALKTFVINGYQIPKGWNVIYSIADTHDDAELFSDNKEEFNPDRFLKTFPKDSSRFGFIPFGGGVRCCVGKEFAKILLKTLIVELCRSCDWELLNGPPTMKTGPIVCPVDNLPVHFKPYSSTL